MENVEQIFKIFHLEAEKTWIGRAEMPEMGPLYLIWPTAPAWPHGWLGVKNRLSINQLLKIHLKKIIQSLFQTNSFYEQAILQITILHPEVKQMISFFTMMTSKRRIRATILSK